MDHVCGQEPTESHGAKLGWGLQDSPPGRWPSLPHPRPSPLLFVFPLPPSGADTSEDSYGPCSRKALPLPPASYIYKICFPQLARVFADSSEMTPHVGEFLGPSFCRSKPLVTFRGAHTG